MQSKKHWMILDKGLNVKPINLSLVQLMEFVLTKNNFQLNCTHYLQIVGTSMGTKKAPSYANVFMGKFEEDFLYTYLIKPLIWKQFIDDCFYIWIGNRESVENFIQYLNSNIQFACDIT